MADNIDKFKPQIEKYIDELKTVHDVVKVLRILYTKHYVQEIKENDAKVKAACELVSHPLVKRAKLLFLESKPDAPASYETSESKVTRSEFFHLTYKQSPWFPRDILNACTVEEIKSIKSRI